jgi:transposase-like protein
MGRVLNIILSSEQRTELELFHKQSNNHVLRQRCQIILLKSSNRKTSDICEIVGIKSQNQVNKWIKRYKTDYSAFGINCLRNLEGQGRKAIFDAKTEAEFIQKVVKTERQKLENAKVILEKELNKSFNIKTLKNFLKVLAGDTNG